MTQLYALTREPAASMESGERTFIDSQEVDFETALRQHEAYRAALCVAGASVEVLDGLPAFPDSVFVEDPVIVFDELAVMGQMGVDSRQDEVAELLPVISRFRDKIEMVQLPGRLEGGDVLVVGRHVYVGLSARTNESGARQLADFLQPYGYQVTLVPVTGCLHLKTGCTALPDGRLLVNEDWIELASFDQNSLLPIPKEEPWSACQLNLGSHMLIDQTHQRTIEMLSSSDYVVLPLDLSEFAKAEAGPTCLSLVFSAE